MRVHWQYYNILLTTRRCPLDIASGIQNDVLIDYTIDSA